MVWTKFMDMYSGGGNKEPQDYIYIEAPEEEARVIFYNRFGHSPGRVTCTCCGSDYSLTEADTLEGVTEYERGNMSVDEYTTRKTVLVIRADEIKPEERTGDVPEEGYVWR